MPVFEVRTTHCVYPNIVRRGLLQQLKNYIPSKASKIFIVTTDEVWQLYGEVLQAQFSDTGRLHVLFFPGGEANKRLSSVEALANQMLEQGADRTSIVIGFGGGIVTDISGFLAAAYMRGIPVVQVPTTLLAQVDAATGGKTGVNLAGGKNLFGSFHHPVAVLIDPDVLSSLPPRELRAGLFEVIKCGVIRDPALFELLSAKASEIQALQPRLLDEAIAAAVRIKAEVVSADEREGDLRRILNFGHTIGHALEAETGYTRLLHGEAVAWGMIAATNLASSIGMLNEAAARRINEAIVRYGPLPTIRDLSPQNIFNRLSRDKKTLGGKVHFVLPTAIGKVKIVSDVPDTTVLKVITEALQ